MARLGLFRGSADQLRGFRQKGPDASRVLFCFSYSFSVLRCFETDSSAGLTLDRIWQGMDRPRGPGRCVRAFEPLVSRFAHPSRKMLWEAVKWAESRFAACSILCPELPREGVSSPVQRNCGRLGRDPVPYRTSGVSGGTSDQPLTSDVLQAAQSRRTR